MKLFILLLLCWPAYAALLTPLKVVVTIDPPVANGYSAEDCEDTFVMTFHEKQGKCITYYTASHHMLSFKAIIITRKITRFYYKTADDYFEWYDQVEESEEIVNLPNLNQPHII